MPTRLAACLSLVCLCSLVGCEPKAAPTVPTTIAPPPGATTSSPPIANPTAPPVDSPATTTNTTPTTPSTGESPPISTPTATETPDAALAPYAAALAIVQPDHFAVMKLDMAALRNSAFLTSLPVNAEQMAGSIPVPGAPGPDGAAEMAKKLEQVETLWVSLGPPRGVDAMPFSLAIYAHCTSPQAATEALAAMQADPAKAERFEQQGNAYFKSKQPGGPIWAVKASDVYISSDENALRNAIVAGGKISDADVLKKLAGAKFDAPLVIAGSFGPFKESLSRMAVDALKESPIKLSPELGKIPAQIDWAVISINPDAEAMLDIDADMQSPESAENLKLSLDGLVSMARIVLQQQQAAAAPAGERDPSADAAMEVIQAALNAIKVQNADRHVDASFNRFPELAKLPEVMKAQMEVANITAHMNNARFLGLAAHNHQSATRNWPENVKGSGGTPLLSWRYVVLPYVEESILFQQFNKSEPWDSETNQALAAPMPAIFQTPSATEPNTTTWKLLANDHPSGVMMLDTGKGTATPWTKPDEFTLDAANTAASLGEEPAGGYIIVNRDGSVERLPRAQLIAKLGGESVVEDAAPAMSLTIEEFVKAFTDDANAANARFMNRTIELTGKLEMFSVSPSGGCDIYLGGTKWATVHDEPWALALPGQTVKAQGVFKGSFPLTIIEAQGERLVVKANELAGQFARNEEAARKKYHERWMELRGVVADKKIDEASGATLILKGAGKTNLECLVSQQNDHAEQSLAAVKVGDAVRVVGLFSHDTLTQGNLITTPLENGATGGDDTVAPPDKEPAAAKLRMWASADGKFTVEAELVKVVGPTVHLKRTNGQVVKVPRDKLSDADQEYLRSLAKNK